MTYRPNTNNSSHYAGRALTTLGVLAIGVASLFPTYEAAAQTRSVTRNVIIMQGVQNSMNTSRRNALEQEEQQRGATRQTAAQDGTDVSYSRKTIKQDPAPRIQRKSTKQALSPSVNEQIGHKLNVLADEMLYATDFPYIGKNVKVVKMTPEEKSIADYVHQHWDLTRFGEIRVKDLELRNKEITKAQEYGDGQGYSMTVLDHKKNTRTEINFFRALEPVHISVTKGATFLPDDSDPDAYPAARAKEDTLLAISDYAPFGLDFRKETNTYFADAVDQVVIGTTKERFSPRRRPSPSLTAQVQDNEIAILDKAIARARYWHNLMVDFYKQEVASHKQYHIDATVKKNALRQKALERSR